MLSKIRELNESDYEKKYFDLLSQLSICKTPKLKDWKIQFQKIKENKTHKIYVIEDIENKQIIGTITLLIEYKMLRNLGCIAHIEDFVVSEEYRKYGTGTSLIEFCIEQSKNKYNCYKLILNCNKYLKEYYEKFKFKHKNIEMSLYF